MVVTAKHYAFLSTPGWRWPKNKSSYKFLILKKYYITVHEVTGTKLPGPKNFTCYDFCLYACMQPHKRRESAFSLKWLLDVFFFMLLYWCTLLVHQCMVSTYWSTIKLRETFQQITQKWCITQTWDLKNLFMWLRIYEIYHICELWVNQICEHLTVVWMCANFCIGTWQCKVYFLRKSFCNSQNASDVVGVVSPINFTKLTSFNVMLFYSCWSCQNHERQDVGRGSHKCPNWTLLCPE